MLAKYIINRQIQRRVGKTLILSEDNLEKYEENFDQFFNNNKKMTKPETFTDHPRMMPRLNGCKWNKKYNRDIERSYDQRRIGFFVNHLLAVRKISIPLR